MILTSKSYGSRMLNISLQFLQIKYMLQWTVPNEHCPLGDQTRGNMQGHHLSFVLLFMPPYWDVLTMPVAWHVLVVGESRSWPAVRYMLNRSQDPAGSCFTSLAQWAGVSLCNELAWGSEDRVTTLKQQCFMLLAHHLMLRLFEETTWFFVWWDLVYIATLFMCI